MHSYGMVLLELLTGAPPGVLRSGGAGHTGAVGGLMSFCFKVGSLDGHSAFLNLHFHILGILGSTGVNI